MMPRPYSADLRARALRACDRAEGSRAAIARRFEVAEATLYGWRKQEREEGRRAAKPARRRPGPGDRWRGAGGGPRPGRGGRRRHPGRVRRALRRAHRAAGQRRADVPDAAPARPDAQKKTLRAEERARADVATERAAYAEQVRGLEPNDLVCVDESGVTAAMTAAMTRRYARAPRGRRALATAPCGHWRRLTLLGALGCDGVVAAMSVEAATSTAVFLAFLDRVLIPELVRTKPGAVVVMDNLRPHKAAAVRARPCAGRAAAALPAALRARTLRDRAVLVQGQGAAARQGGTDRRGAGRGARPRARRRHRPRRPRLLPRLRLRRCSKLIRKPL